MDPLALALVIAGALCHASWNLISKKVGGGLYFVALYGLVSSLLCLPLALQAWHAHPAPLGLAAWVAIGASALIHAVYSLILQRGYRAADFSLVYPLARGSGPLFSVVGAVLLLGEVPGATGLTGIAAILVGILLLSGLAEIRRSPRLRAGVFWGGLTGLSIAAYTVLDGWAIKVLGLAPLLYYGLSLLVRNLLLLPQALRRPDLLLAEWRGKWRAIVAVGILSPLAYSLVLTALTRAPLSYVAPLRELSMLAGVLLGSRLLQEKISPLRALGIAGMLLGATLLALAKPG